MHLVLPFAICKSLYDSLYKNLNISYKIRHENSAMEASYVPYENNLGLAIRNKLKTSLYTIF